MTSYVAKRQKPLVVVDAAAAKKRMTTSTSMNAQRMCAAISSRSKDVERVIGMRSFIITRVYVHIERTSPVLLLEMIVDSFGYDLKRLIINRCTFPLKSRT
ncbi:hypothetical protein B9Z55_014050 [Caenorhabditis nigoni]|uniref:Uncharacterized protein n=1 Tax=Caenorhabditis nigoni TaxID=1611254 RepID=A0A2G5U4A9_9PELO|nr:hypothetical protein B9Z55_014050 [Caenorhabditis nigoni]